MPSALAFALKLLDIRSMAWWLFDVGSIIKTILSDSLIKFKLQQPYFRGTETSAGDLLRIKGWTWKNLIVYKKDFPEAGSRKGFFSIKEDWWQVNKRKAFCSTKEKSSCQVSSVPKILEYSFEIISFHSSIGTVSRYSQSLLFNHTQNILNCSVAMPIVKKSHCLKTFECQWVNKIINYSHFLFLVYNMHVFFTC